MGFGGTVRAKRKERGLTLEQLSERSNITPNYLGRVENEKVDPSLSIVLAIARALRASVAELTDGPRGEAREQVRRARKSAAQEAREAAQLYARLPLDVQEVLLPALRVIAHRTAVKRPRSRDDLSG
jgi:transcriptional regulator with XRE-family HTH domain